MPLFLAACCMVMSAAAMAALLDRGILAIWMFGGALIAATVWLAIDATKGDR
jgi:hypothetical protein